MSDRPILFSGPMVRALLAGRKTQTRRIVKPPALVGRIAIADDSQFVAHEACPFGQPGDRLWVRETWKPTGLFASLRPSLTASCGRFAYAADEIQRSRDQAIKWRPSIHMPRWASRITLEIVKVRIERLQAITEADALAEGVAIDKGHAYAVAGSEHFVHRTAAGCFETLWGQTYGLGSWAANPWVWVVEFRRVEA